MHLGDIDGCDAELPLVDPEVGQCLLLVGRHFEQDDVFWVVPADDNLLEQIPVARFVPSAEEPAEVGVEPVRSDVLRGEQGLEAEDGWERLELDEFEVEIAVFGMDEAEVHRHEVRPAALVRDAVELRDGPVGGLHVGRVVEQGERQIATGGHHAVEQIGREEARRLADAELDLGAGLLVETGAQVGVGGGCEVGVEAVAIGLEHGWRVGPRVSSGPERVR